MKLYSANFSLSCWLIISFLLAVGDSFWNTIRTTVITHLYQNNSSQAFALSKFFQVMYLSKDVNFCLAFFNIFAIKNFKI